MASLYSYPNADCDGSAYSHTKTSTHTKAPTHAAAETIEISGDQ